ncbi:MAG: VanW family protein [Patescibacteria group bacterium]
MIFQKKFLKFAGRLSITGIIVLGGTYVGSGFYISKLTRIPEKTKLRNFSEELNNLTANGLDIYIQEDKKTITGEKIKSWFEQYERSYSGETDLRISQDKIGEYVGSIAQSVNTQPVNAKITIVSGKAEEFVPPKYGRSLDMGVSKNLLIKAVVTGAKEVTFPVKFIEPAVTLDKANELGITTLIGTGESDFKGSSQARIHNIKIGSTKYNGAIIKPGDEFSFNSILGEVNEENGFESELVIKSGKLTKEAGGGLCQVSTTLFRSAIMAGLPITERKPHSFAVRYYNPQGFDATIYPRVVDLKFKNDTPNHILIQSRVEGTKLTFEIYGPNDGRKVTLDGPVQHDQKPNGSMKAHFIRRITSADGSTKEERFDSTYGAPAPLERNPLE